MKLLVSAVLALSSLPLGAGAGAQQGTLEHPIHDQLSLKLRTGYPRPEDPYADLLVTTGDPGLDRLLRSLGVHQVRRVFRRPPRGWRSESAAAAAGLERWLELRWREQRADLDQVSAVLGEHPAVELCERVGELRTFDTTPNDPNFPQQYALQNGLLNAPKAWDLQTTSTRILAILDSGTDQDHKDLVNNLWVNAGEIPGNGIDDEGNGFIDDDLGWDHYYGDNDPEDVWGHGVHVMGIAGAETNNTRQIAGVCWSVPLMNVQVINDTGGVGPFAAGDGIVYAADNGASVLSMSWGGSTDFSMIRNAVQYADSLGCLQIAAAGNRGNTQKQYPAAYAEVMGIIGTDQGDQKMSLSSYGSWCDMAAPGDQILSTWQKGLTRTLSGTSMAAPHVSGAAALLLEVNPMLDHVDARWVLNHSSEDLGAPGFNDRYGWGRLDLLAALEMGQALQLSTATALPGSSVTIDLDFPKEPGFVHFLLISRNGRVPGFALDGFDPTDSRRAAINPDLVLWNFLIAHPTGGGLFLDFVDVLDGAGQNQATLNVPPGPLFQGLDLDFVALTLDPTDLTRISSVSGSNRLTVQ